MAVQAITIGGGVLEINAVPGPAHDDVLIQATPDPATGDRFFEVFHRQVGDPSYTKLPILFGSTPTTIFTHQVTNLLVRLDETTLLSDGGNDILHLQNIKPEFGFDLPTEVATPNLDEAIHVEGMAGHDLIFGSAFADCIKTGEPEYPNTTDNDIVFAGDGNDYVEGKSGGDHLYGEGGDDILRGFTVDAPSLDHNDGDDFLYGGPGEDQLHDSTGNDVLNGGKGVDSYFLDNDDELDTIIDEIIRDANGVGDFNGDGEIDRNWIDFPANVGDVTVQFDHDYTPADDTVIYTIDKTGDQPIPIGTVNNRGDARFLLVETIDAMFIAIDDFLNHGGPLLLQWDFNGDNTLYGSGVSTNTSTSDSKFFLDNIVGSTLGDANLDGNTNLTDLTVLGIHWQLPGIETWTDGDLNGDGIVDAKDLNILVDYL